MYKLWCIKSDRKGAGMLRYAILGMLGYQPMTGYGVKHAMDSSTGYFWHAKLSQIYTTLKQLEKEGAVSSAVERQATRPEKRVYSITDAGRRDLDEWLAAPLIGLDPRKETLLLKVFFSGRLDRETLLTNLHLQRELHRKQAELYRTHTAREIARAAAQNPAVAKDAMLWEATRRFGERLEDLMVNWLDETRRLVEENW